MVVGLETEAVNNVDVSNVAYITTTVRWLW